MPTEIISLTIPAGNVTPIPVSLAGANQTLFLNTGAAPVAIQTTADSTEADIFLVNIQPMEPVSITGTDDEYLYVRGLVGQPATSISIMIMRRS